MEMVSAVSQHPPVTPSVKKPVTRPTVEYEPTVWGDYFINLPPSIAPDSRSWMLQRSEKLKQEAKTMLRDENDMLSKVGMVDTIQRLGLAYHFEQEINEALNEIYEARLENKDLYAVAFRFRLLRQEGYNITTDEFNMFMDEDGKFLETLRDDVKGLLCLYEAAYLATHEDVILHKAVKFCRDELKAKLNHVEHEVAIQIAHALEIPLHRRSKRLESRQYISMYETFEQRNDQLLELAKLDFNLLLSLHQEEIKSICLWWKELGLATKLTFARDKIVEGYFWILGIYFEPSWSRARIMSTKVLAFISYLDDIYDAYGTLEELQVFTDVLQRWDVGALNLLPGYLKIYFIALVKVFKEIEDELVKEGHSCRVDYLKNGMIELARAYFQEAKWGSEAYIPPFEVHLSSSLITAACKALTCASWIGMGEIATKEAFEWIVPFPKIIKGSSAIGRIMNDIVSYEREERREHVASTIQCYMKEHDTSLEDTFIKLQEMIEDAWKDINEESLKPIAIPLPLLTPIINLARISVTFYRHNDEYTNSSKGIKEKITLLIIEPIPV